MSDRSQNRRWLAPLGGLALVASLSSPASAGLVFTQQIRGDGDAAKY